jgi:Protein of unknown function (DUF1579)
MKTILRVTMLLVLGGLCAMPLAAQEGAMSAKPKAAKPAAKAKEQTGMPMPKPAPEMTKMIKMMAGTWTTTEKDDPSPMMPKGGTGKGTAILTPGPGGLSLTEKYHSSGGMGSNFNGLGTFWWDSKAQLYRGVWCDNMSPNGCDASGSTKWEGDKLVGTMEGEMNGQKMMTRFTYDFKPNSFVMMMESGPDASKMQRMMTITYTKAGGAAEKKM